MLCQMPQTTTGFRSVLSSPILYDVVQTGLGFRRSRSLLAERYIRAKPGDSILDIGCGTAEILDFLPSNIQYTGCDISTEYIEAARKRFPNATFYTGALPQGGSFDIVLALCVLHHLSDDESIALFNAAKSVLKPGGRVITLDACYTDGQNPITRVLFKMDRGRNIRDEPGFSRLAASIFGEVKTSVVTDLVPPWVPYTHIIMECATPLEPQDPPV